MPPVPVLRPSEIIKAFKKIGWEVSRQRGSHIILTKPGSISSLSVPNHKTVAKGTLRSLINKADLSINEFMEALKN